MRGWKGTSLLAVVWLATAATAEPGKGLFRVTASTDTGVFPVGWWTLEIREDGTAKLSRDGRATAETTIRQERMEGLRQAVREVFTMYPHQGAVCIDCPMCILAVEADGRKGTVYLAPFREKTPTAAEVKSARQALAMWAAVKAAAGQQELPDPCSRMLMGAK